MMLSAKALFVSKGPSGATVWVTDGTASGTVALPFAPDPGFTHPVLIDNRATTFYSFNNKLMYFDIEQAGRPPFADKLQIHITDGTAAGTSELAVGTDDVFNLSSAVQSGRAAQLGGRFLIFDKFTSVVGKLPTAEFLVTDGTSAGTKTFTITGDPLPPFGLSFTPGPFFGLGNLVLFAATDSDGLNSLWVSNGTAAGTAPLSVKGAATGPFGGLRPTDFTALGARALFLGEDGRSDGLWITDGTAAGTHELTTGISAGQITVAGNKAFFLDSPGFIGDLLGH